MNELLWISFPDKIHFNYGVEYFGENVDNFYEAVRQVTSNSSGIVFGQGKQGNWGYFEFWTDNQEWILKTCMKISENLNIELLMEEPSLEEIQKPSKLS